MHIGIKAIALLPEIQAKTEFRTTLGVGLLSIIVL